MIFFKILFFLLNPMPVQADYPILKCDTKTSDGVWNSNLELTSLGNANLNLQRGKNKFSCRLGITHFTSIPQSIRPSTQFSFVTESCDFADWKKEVLPRVHLIINWDNVKPSPVVEWYANGLTPNCSLSVFEKQEFKLAEEKWDHGNWGARAAFPKTDRSR